jgi:hypothetical protein
LYCSAQCKKQYNGEKQTEGEQCLFCGNTFAVRTNRKYCSTQCRNRYTWLKKNPSHITERKCPNCGKLFRKEVGVRGPMVYCCIECGKAYSEKQRTAKRRAEREKRSKEKICPNCGKEFVDHFYGGTPRRFCSKACSRKWHRPSSAKRPHRCVTANNPDIWRHHLARAATKSGPFPKRRVWLVCGATKGHGIDRLVSVIRHELGADPCNGDLYVFCDEARTSLRHLEWDGAGFCLGHRKAQAGTYPWPSKEWGATIEITEKEFVFLRSRSVIEPAKRP